MNIIRLIILTFIVSYSANLWLGQIWLDRLLSILLVIFRVILTFSVLRQTWLISTIEKRSRVMWDLFVVTGISVSDIIKKRWASLFRQYFIQYTTLALFGLLVAIRPGGLPFSPATLSLEFPVNLPRITIGSIISSSVLLFLFNLIQLNFFITTGLFAASLARRFPPSTFQLWRRYLTIVFVSITALLVLLALFAQYTRMTSSFLSPPYIQWLNVNILAIAILIDGGAVSLAYPLFAMIRGAYDYWPAVGTPLLVISVYTLWILSMPQLITINYVNQGIMEKGEVR